jgi:alkanesulfonate monooxygenase SsuD/methylene tetrahydromethanopterin reductase-like flavin-dependent oxidoreductase (luciferase family)
MGFGISFLPDGAPKTKSPVTYFADALELSEIADDAGLRFVKMTEHYLHPYGGYCPSPLMFLSAVAARTRQIRLFTGAILPVFHHPLQIASEVALLDALSGGRAEIGFARAYLPYEFEAFGIPLDESRDRFTQTVKAVTRLWREADVSIESEFFAFHKATVLPRCTQTPHPPVWVAAVRSRQSFAWIGEEGFKLLVTPGFTGPASISEFISIYRESFRAPPEGARSGQEVAISLPLYIRDTDAAACAEADSYLGRYLEVWADAAKAWDAVGSRDYPGYSGMAGTLRATTPEAMRRSGAAIVGCPQHVVEQIHRLREELSIDHILWQVDFGAMPGEAARQTLTRFIEKVLPACQLKSAQLV